jgi:hypothetical protein
MEIHAALVEIDHVQSRAVVMCTEPLPPLWMKDTGLPAADS